MGVRRLLYGCLPQLTPSAPLRRRCFQEETTYTRTITAPGATATYHDPRTTTAQYTTNVYPRAMAARTLAEEAFPEETTIVEVQPCAETVYTTPTSTFVNPQYTTTVTEWAATTTIWSTYT